MRDKIRPINGWKLKNLLSYKGTQSQIAEELGFCQSTISKAICCERISYALAGRLEERYGIKFEQYSNEEEPSSEESTAKIDNTSEDKLNTIISQLAEICNELTAIYQKLGN